MTGFIPGDAGVPAADSVRHLVNKMHHVIVAWATSNTENFEAAVPLKFIARRYRRLGYQAAFEVIMLRGYHNLDPDYRDSLSDLGFQLQDAAPILDEIHSQFSTLDRFGDYEVYCFLRWLVLHRIFGSDPLVHYDGDVVLNVPPEELGARFIGTTFVLQGCPALTVVSNPVWYDHFERELREFSRDIDGYSARSWQERSGWRDSFENKWAGSRYREIISSDQDLISHLIHTDRLPQSQKRILLTRLQEWLAIENPLYPDTYYGSKGLEYQRLNDVDYFGSRPLMMWHMQTAFYLYLARHLMQSRYLPILTRTRLHRDPAWLGRLGYRILRKLSGSRFTQRRAIYGVFFDRMDFSSILNDHRWWKSGVFC